MKSKKLTKRQQAEIEEREEWRKLWALYSEMEVIRRKILSILMRVGY